MAVFIHKETPSITDMGPAGGIRIGMVYSMVKYVDC